MQPKKLHINLVKGSLKSRLMQCNDVSHVLNKSQHKMAQQYSKLTASRYNPFLTNSLPAYIYFVSSLSQICCCHELNYVLGRILSKTYWTQENITAQKQKVKS